MKWPIELSLVRHGESAFNAMKEGKGKSELYELFCKAFEKNPDSRETRELALRVRSEFALGVGDYETPLTERGWKQAVAAAEGLKKIIGLPDVAFVSPYLRARETFRAMFGGWPELASVRVYHDDRIREQEHGLALIYNDWRVMHVLHPEQRALRQLQGSYWYQFPQGESVSQVRDRIRSWMGTLVREFSERRVLAITHHLTLLSVRANLERWTPEEFVRVDEEEKPVNCGVTMYRGNPNLGENGKLVLARYNKAF